MPIFGSKEKVKKIEEAAIGTIIGESSKVIGNLEGKDGLRIDGVVEGEIKIESLVVIGKKGVVRGNITSTNLSVLGKVEGDINCTEKVELLSSAHIKGNISAARVELQDGAVLKGKVDIKSDEISES